VNEWCQNIEFIVWKQLINRCCSLTNPFYFPCDKYLDYWDRLSVKLLKVGIKLQLFFIIQRHSVFKSFSTSERLIFGVAIILAMHGYFPFLPRVNTKNRRSQRTYMSFWNEWKLYIDLLYNNLIMNEDVSFMLCSGDCLSL
jgi:hypothetical protein